MAIAVGVDVADHPHAVLERALQPQSLHHLVKLTRRDQSVLVEIVEVEGVAKLLARSAIHELRELQDVNVAVAVSVELRHYAAHFLQRRSIGAELTEHVPELVAGDLSVAVLVELVEDYLQLLPGSHRADSRAYPARVRA